MWPSDYPSANSWQLFAQWHQDDCCGSPPVEFYVVGEQMRLRVGGETGQVLWTAPLARGNWHDFVFHVKWSTDPNSGFVELYYDGQLVLPKHLVAAQFAGALNYFKQGLYRDAAISPDAVIFHDGMTMATTLEDVMPPPQALLEFRLLMIHVRLIMPLSRERPGTSRH